MQQPVQKRQRRILLLGGYGYGLSVPVYLDELGQAQTGLNLQRLSLHHAGINWLTDLLIALYGLVPLKLVPVSRRIRRFAAAMKYCTRPPVGLSLHAEAVGNANHASVSIWHNDLYDATAAPVARNRGTHLPVSTQNIEETRYATLCRQNRTHHRRWFGHGRGNGQTTHR